MIDAACAAAAHRDQPADPDPDGSETTPTEAVPAAIQRARVPYVATRDIPIIIAKRLGGSYFKCAQASRFDKELLAGHWMDLDVAEENLFYLGSSYRGFRP